MNINLVQVKAFLTVARFGSFTKAAQLLHISQPALTVQIQQFEKELNLRLFDRNTRHVDLTRTGRELIPLLKRSMDDFETMIANAQGLVEKRQGTVRLACLAVLASTFLPDAIARFGKKHPQIGFVVKDAIGKDVAAMVRADEVEFGITDEKLNQPDLETFKLTQDRMHVIFPNHHPIGRRKTISLKMLIKYPLILLQPASNSRIMLEDAFAIAGYLVKPSCEVTYSSAAVGLVRAGLGLALLPTFSLKATNLRSLSGLKFRCIDDPPLVRNITLIQKLGRSLTPATRSFVDQLLEESRRGSEKEGRTRR